MLLQRFAVVDHVLVLLGVIVVGEFRLGAGRRGGVAGLDGDEILHLADDLGFLGRLAGNRFGLVDFRQRALVVAGVGKILGFLQGLALFRADCGGRRGREDQGAAANRGGTDKE